MEKRRTYNRRFAKKPKSQQYHEETRAAIEKFGLASERPQDIEAYKGLKQRRSNLNSYNPDFGTYDANKILNWKPSETMLRTLTYEDLPLNNFVHVRTKVDLEDVAKQLLLQPEVAVDLEYSNLGTLEHSLTCLITISTPFQDILLDVFPLWNLIEPVLGPFFRSESVLKIFADCSNDLIRLRQDFCIAPVAVADLIRGFGKWKSLDTLPSLSRICEHFQLPLAPKFYNRADFRKRPLAFELQQYAVQDSKSTLKAWSLMKGEILKEGNIPIHDGINNVSKFSIVELLGLFENRKFKEMFLLRPYKAIKRKIYAAQEAKKIVSLVENPAQAMHIQLVTITLQFVEDKARELDLKVEHLWNMKRFENWLKMYKISTGSILTFSQECSQNLSTSDRNQLSNLLLPSTQQLQPEHNYLCNNLDVVDPKPQINASNTAPPIKARLHITPAIGLPKSNLHQSKTQERQKNFVSPEPIPVSVPISSDYFILEDSVSKSDVITLNNDCLRADVGSASLLPNKLKRKSTHGRPDPLFQAKKTTITNQIADEA